ncbi:hypothetical protein [Psychroserpens sp.]|uniref:hypothetical protein n=1 Tax=Psychroserpens sp. TaxID=2020870 RepID=UPI00385D5FE2
MKKLMMIAIAFLTLSVTAQDKKNKKDFLKDLSAEEIATLKTKKMTLELDLTESQQLKIKSLILEEANHRKQQKAKFEEKKKDERPSKEERFTKANERLDRKIELKKQMKSILNDEQYKKWETTLNQRGKKKQKKTTQK